METIPQVNFTTTIKPLSLPQIQANSMNSTKSELNCILSDRKTFVSKYFEDINKNSKKGVKKTQQLGNFITNGWKIKALLLDDQYIVLHARKGSREMTKKYLWARVRTRMNNGLEQWVQLKF